MRPGAAAPGPSADPVADPVADPAADLAAWVLGLGPGPALPGGPRVVAVDGPSGAGKTRLAGAVADALPARGAGVAVVHLDDLYPGWDGLEAVVPLVVDHVLRPLAAAGAVVVPGWDWDAGRPGAPRRLDGLGPPRPGIVLLEGAGAGARAASPWLAGLVWVDAPARLRRERALARDGDAYAPHWERWARQERAHFARERTAGRADRTVDG